MGEEEYGLAVKKMNKVVQEISNGQIEKIKSEYDDKVSFAVTKANERILELENQYKHELENKASQMALLQIKKIQSNNDEEKQEMERGYRQELACKDKEIEEAKLQNAISTEEKIAMAIESIEEKYRQREAELKLQIERARNDNEKLQKTLDSVPPEIKGTAGEITLFDDLHTAFPQDQLMPKIVGKEMPDVIQTIVTENGERIATPILWDMKTGESITTEDIKKAKKYKEKYSSDYCILVTTNGITSKDSKIRRAGLIGKRDGILLIHQSLAVGVAEETRNFIVEMTRLIKNNNGRASKEVRLYDYITSPLRFRKMQKKMESKLKLEELIRKQEDYNKKAWSEQKKIIKDSFEFDKDDQETINDITQQDQSNEAKEEERLIKENEEGE
jgi:hypothetical protein